MKVAYLTIEIKPSAEGLLILHILHGSCLNTSDHVAQDADHAAQIIRVALDKAGVK